MAEVDDQQLQGEIEAEPEPEPTTKIAIRRKKDFDSLQVIFPHQGQLSFEQFRNALIAAGLSCEPQYGSVYMFCHSSGRTVSFHREHGHGGNEIPRGKLFDFAADLRILFGWNADSFELRR